jgi:hypothetical protein
VSLTLLTYFNARRLAFSHDDGRTDVAGIRRRHGRDHAPGREAGRRGASRARAAPPDCWCGLLDHQASVDSLQPEAASPAAVREAAVEIVRQLARLDRIVTAMLDFARPLRLELAPVNVAALVWDAAGAVLDGWEVPLARIALQPQLGTIVTDGGRLRGVLANLLENARQSVGEASRNAGVEAIGSVAAEPPGGRVRLWVEDRGIRIPRRTFPASRPAFTTRHREEPRPRATQSGELGEPQDAEPGGEGARWNPPSGRRHLEGLRLVRGRLLRGACSAPGGGEMDATDTQEANFAEVIVGVDPDPAINPRLVQWAKDYWLALHPFSAGGGYVNMMMDEGPDNVKAAYRDNYARLAQVKRKYDPENLFRVNQNIKPGDR